MKKDWIQTLLEGTIAQRRPVTLHRRKLGASPLPCVPLALGKTLMLSALYADFQPDGYEVVRLRDITNVHSDERTAFYERIMAAEGVLDAIVDPGLPLDDLPALLAALRERREPVTVEDGGGVFLLGFIEKTGKSKLRLRYISTGGRMGAESARMPYEDIASVCFGGRYVRLVARYAEAAEGAEAEVEAETAAPADPAPVIPGSVDPAPIELASTDPAPISTPEPRRKPGPKPKPKGDAPVKDASNAGAAADAAAVFEAEAARPSRKKKG
jgi:hypothetical protein